MTQVDPNLILYPVFAMFYLTAGVLTYMGITRFGAVRRRTMNADFYKTYDRGEEPEHMRKITRNFINLFEVPVLFYTGVTLTYVTHQVSYWLIGCAWLYVALRYVHSYIHLTSNEVLLRFRIYIASGAVLLVMWTSLLVEILRASD